jgi:hypothetical protein
MLAKIQEQVIAKITCSFYADMAAPNLHLGAFLLPAWSNGGGRPYFNKNPPSKNLTAARAAIGANPPAASSFLAQ